MPRKIYAIPEPTTEYVHQRQVRFDGDESYFGVDPAITGVFAALPCNVALADVLAKAAIVDRLYSTNVYAIYAMAQHIVALDIDTRLNGGDIELVEQIATLKGDKGTRRHYSFATKYCSFSQPKLFHIYDSYVEWLIWEYQRRFRFGDFRREELRHYPSYQVVISTFVQAYGLESLTAKELDKFLWIEASTLKQ